MFEQSNEPPPRPPVPNLERRSAWTGFYKHINNKLQMSSKRVNKNDSSEEYVMEDITTDNGSSKSVGIVNTDTEEDGQLSNESDAK